MSVTGVSHLSKVLKLRLSLCAHPDMSPSVIVDVVIRAAWSVVSALFCSCCPRVVSRHRALSVGILSAAFANVPSPYVLRLFTPSPKAICLLKSYCRGADSLAYEPRDN